MQVRIKKGHDLLSLPFGDIIEIHKCIHSLDKYILIINFKNKYTFIDFTQKGNHLLIDTEEGEIDLVFTGEIPVLEYDTFCKDQLILKIKK